MIGFIYMNVPVPQSTDPLLELSNSEKHFRWVFKVLLDFHCTKSMFNFKVIIQKVVFSPRKVTASRPSSKRWSYVRATTMMGRMTICPSTTTGRSLMVCIPFVKVDLSKKAKIISKKKKKTYRGRQLVGD